MSTTVVFLDFYSHFCRQCLEVKISNPYNAEIHFV